MAMMIGKTEGVSPSFVKLPARQDGQTAANAVTKGKTIGLKTLSERKTEDIKAAADKNAVQISAAYKLHISDEGIEKYQVSKKTNPVGMSSNTNQLINMNGVGKTTQEIVDKTGDGEIIHVQAIDMECIYGVIGGIFEFANNDKYKLFAKGFIAQDMESLRQDLNGYLEDYGNKDGFFGDLTQQLDQLANPGENQLVDQIRSMVQQVQGGKKIVKDENFDKSVTKAIDGYFSEVQSDPTKSLKSKKTQIQKNFSNDGAFAEFRKIKTREAKELMDKMLGSQDSTDKDARDASVGDIEKGTRSDAVASSLQASLRAAQQQTTPVTTQPLAAAAATGDESAHKDAVQKQVFQSDWQNIIKNKHVK